MSSETSPSKRSVGRPRDPALETRIKDAGLKVLAEHGFSGLTLDRVCAEAGIPKATFYRRWDSPRTLVSDAFNERFQSGLLGDTGDVIADLRVFARVLLDLYTDPLLGPCLLFIVTESKARPESAAAFAEAQAQRRRHNVATLEQALARQGFAPRIDARTILTVLNGTAFYSYAAGQRVTAETFDQLVPQLLQPHATATP